MATSNSHYWQYVDWLNAKQAAQESIYQRDDRTEAEHFASQNEEYIQALKRRFVERYTPTEFPSPSVTRRRKLLCLI